MVLLASETDFVSRNAEFVALAKEIAMHVAAQNPKFISREEVGEEAIAKAREVFAEDIKDKPAEMQEKIFERFVQVEGSEHITRTGRGLGLAFCKLAVEAHGGSIWVEDGSPGALFCVRLPNDR